MSQKKKEKKDFGVIRGPHQVKEGEGEGEGRGRGRGEGEWIEK